MLVASFFSFATFVQFALSLPQFTAENAKNVVRTAQSAQCKGQDQKARLFVVPPAIADTSAKKIPDGAHPFKAPGPNDTRGPCPMLNTLANHGYINRTGIDTSENIIHAVMEGVNMEHDFAAFAVGFATMARGNANIAKLSIGFPSEEVPPLPGCIDGPEAGGLAKHNRFEGDVSNSRVDHGLGDSVNFNQTSFDAVLEYVKMYGDDGPDGPRTVLNTKVFMEFKYDLFNWYQKHDKQLQFHVGRQLTAYSEVAFILDLMQDGRTGNLTVKQLESFFEHQTFGDDFYRRNGAAGLPILAKTGMEVMIAHPIPAGQNDENMNYIPDVPNYTNFVCDGYYDLATKQLPAVLMNTTGILKQNVMTMLEAMYKPFHDTSNCTQKGFPTGPAGI